MRKLIGVSVLLGCVGVMRAQPTQTVVTKAKTDTLSMARSMRHMTLEPGTNVFTFAIVTVGVFGDGVDLSRIDDKTYR